MPEAFAPHGRYYYNIRTHLIEALERYFNEHIETGGFLRAVLENDLQGAVRRQNPASLSELRWLLEMLVDCAPSNAWGSKEAVARWLSESEAPS
jgi:hypothetical protein